MYIEPRVPRETADNSRGQRSKRRWLVNSVLVVSFFLGLYVVLGWIALGLVHVMPIAWENRFNAAIPADWQAEPPANVQRIFEELTAADESGRRYRLFVIPEDAPNAFALPGGTIGVTRGLLADCQSEQELAFVLGHEIGHLQARHNLKRLSRGVVYALTSAVLFGENNALLPLQQVEQLAGLKYSRNQENEADRTGLALVHQRYGHIGGADQFLVKTAAQQDFSLAWASTHPEPAARCRALAHYAADQGWQARAVTPLVIETHETRAVTQPVQAPAARPNQVDAAPTDPTH